MSEIRNVVLVHGGFVDGSGWQGVYDLLVADGFRVSVVQNPTLSLEDDVIVTRRAIDAFGDGNFAELRSPEMKHSGNATPALWPG